MLFKKQLLSGFIIVFFLLTTSIDNQWFKLGSKIKISQKIRNKHKLNSDDVSEHNYRFDQREVAYRMNFGWSAELPDEVDVIGDDDLIM